MKITVDMVMAMEPCREYPRERVEDLAAGREYITVRDISGLDIPVIDRIWICSHLLGTHDPTRSVARNIVVDIRGDMDMPPECVEWLDTGEESLRRAARNAAYAWLWKTQGDVWGAAMDAVHAIVGGAGSDPGSAAWLVARRTYRYGRIARRRYLGWMVKYLEEV